MRIRTPSALTVITALSTLLLGCTQPAPATAPLAAEPRNIEAHVAFLADDLLEGREAGTRGYDLAALYVASQFAQLGLQPAGDDGGWLQTVPLLRGERRPNGNRFVVERDGGALEFAFQEQFLPAIGFHGERWNVRAPMVFVGQAVVAPEFEHDDLAGVDVRGKIAVMLSGAPERFGHAPRALYSASRDKQRLLAERGAVGIIHLGDPKRDADSPWARSAANWRQPGMRLRDADGGPIDTFPQLRGQAFLSAASVPALFEGAPQSAEEIFERLELGTLQAFDLPGEAILSGRSRLLPIESSNVVGQLPGAGSTTGGASADPRDNEHIVYTAHLDHVGIGAPVNGDSIYNGALDNAVGIAIMLEAARLAAAAPPTARSQVFVAVTAEEKGLLGAEHFAESPGLAGRIVANINMDMPVLLSPLRDVIPIGVEHSSLGPIVATAAAELDIALTLDPSPQEVVFVRSDQFAFVRRGIPAVYLKGGIHSELPSVDGRAQMDDFRRQHYHQPSDQIDLGIHYPTAARMAALNQRIGSLVGNAEHAPRWNPDDLFGRRFAPDAN